MHDDGKDCLHCKICKVISNHAADVGDTHNGKTVLNAAVSLRALADVAGDLIASAPERQQRKILVRRLVEQVMHRVRVVRDRGDQATNIIIGGRSMQ